MTVDELGAWVDFIGGLAVVAVNREARLAANERYADSLIKLVNLIASDSEMADIWSRGGGSIAQLTTPERVRFVSFVSNNFLRTFENLHSHYEGGRLESHVWDGGERTLGRMFATPGVVEVW